MTTLRNALLDIARSQDTAPNLDGVADGPDPWTPAEAAASLDFHAARAVKSGNYGLAEDLAEVVRVIERLEQRIDELEAK